MFAFKIPRVYNLSLEITFDPTKNERNIHECGLSFERAAKFTRYAISVNGTAGAGTQFVIGDLDGDGDIDIATAGKNGVHFFENLKVDRVPKALREKELLLNTNWPFPGEGKYANQENGPAPK